jgi:hypothetical protein
LIANIGDTIVIATNYSGEYGTFSDQGLILVNAKSGTIAHLSDSNEYYLSIKLIDRTLWITSNRDIKSWDLKTNIWRYYQANKHVVNKNCELYRHPIQYGDFRKGHIPTRRVLDTLIAIQKLRQGEIITCYWPDEMKYDRGVKGWIFQEDFYQLTNQTEEEFALNFGSHILYSDSLLQKPCHSFVKARIRKLKETGNAVNVVVYSAFIQIDNINPMFLKVKENPLPNLNRQNLLTSKTNILDQAFATLESEQEELQKRNPITDKIVTISDTIDLYDQVRDILYARWLMVKDNSYPQGIRLNDSTEIWVRNGKLEYRNKVLAVGDTICSAEGDAFYEYKILGYSAKGTFGNQLKELVFQYIVIMTPQLRDYQEY